MARKFKHVKAINRKRSIKPQAASTPAPIKLTALPNEMILHTVKFLAFEEIENLSKSSKQMHAIFQQPTVFSELYRLRGYHYIQPLEDITKAKSEYIKLEKSFRQNLTVKQYNFLLSIQLGDNNAVYGHMARHSGSTVRKLVEHDPKLFQDQYGNSGLHWAALTGNLELLNLYVNYGCTIDQTNNDRKTPLMLAVENGHVACVETLLNRGAVSTVNNDGENELFVAITKAGNYDLVETLLQHGFDIKFVNPQNISLLMAAVETKHVNIVELLLRSGADTSVVDSDGCTVMHSAAYSYVPEIWDMISRIPGIDFTKLSNQNVGLIHFAAEAGSLPCLLKALEHGATLHDVDADGCDAFKYACRQGQLDFIQDLSSRGITMHSLDIKLKDGLAHAAENGHIDVVAYILTNCAYYRSDVNHMRVLNALNLYITSKNADTTDVFINHLANFNATNRNKILNAALLTAVKANDIAWARKLIAAGANILGFDATSTAPNRHYTPLVLAAKNANLELLNVLINLGANVDDQSSEYSYTALMLACRYNHLDCVRALLSAGADPNLQKRPDATIIRDTTVTAFDIAEAAGNAAISKELFQDSLGFEFGQIIKSVKQVLNFPFRNYLKAVFFLSSFYSGLFGYLAMLLAVGFSLISIPTMPTAIAPLLFICAFVISPISIGILTASIPSVALLATAAATFVFQAVRYTPAIIQKVSKNINNSIFEFGCRLLGFEKGSTILRDFSNSPKNNPESLFGKLGFALGKAMVRFSCFFSGKKLVEPEKPKVIEGLSDTENESSVQTESANTYTGVSVDLSKAKAKVNPEAKLHIAAYRGVFKPKDRTSVPLRDLFYDPSLVAEHSEAEHAVTRTSGMPASVSVA